MLTNDSQMLTIGIVVATNVPMRVSPATPVRTMAVLANAALIEKARRLCFEAWWCKQGVRISSSIAVSEPISFTAVVRDFPKRSCSS
jgi:hypothetical protein